jgi:hypothetical protein
VGDESGTNDEHVVNINNSTESAPALTLPTVKGNTISASASAGASASASARCHQQPVPSAASQRPRPAAHTAHTIVTARVRSGLVRVRVSSQSQPHSPALTVTRRRVYAP